MRAALVKSFGTPECINIVCNQTVPKLEKGQVSHSLNFVQKNFVQVLVRVAASGVNPVDTYVRSGQYGVLPKLPYIPGRDGAGEIHDVAEDVSNFKKGDKVWFISNNGSAAEYVIPTYVFPLPKGISFTEGAALGIPYLTACRALFMKYPLENNAKILIHGASGGVGLAACQLAAWKGATVVGTAGTEEGCANVLRNGASMVYNHREENYFEKMKEEHSRGYDLIIEMAAHLNLGKDLALLGKNGKIAIVGSRGEVPINPRLLMTMESAIYGVSLVHSTENEYTHMSKEITQMLTMTSYRPVVHKEYKLEELSQAHSDIINNSGSKGNLIVKL